MSEIAHFIDNTRVASGSSRSQSAFNPTTDPRTLEERQTGGLLRDFGDPLIDHPLWLLGPAISVHARLDVVEPREDVTDASFVLIIDHTSGLHSHLSSSNANHLTVREFRRYGEGGSYVPFSTDLQTQAIFALCESDAVLNSNGIMTGQV